MWIWQQTSGVRSMVSQSLQDEHRGRCSPCPIEKVGPALLRKLCCTGGDARSPSHENVKRFLCDLSCLRFQQSLRKFDRSSGAAHLKRHNLARAQACDGQLVRAALGHMDLLADELCAGGVGLLPQPPGCAPLELRPPSLLCRCLSQDLRAGPCRRANNTFRPTCMCDSGQECNRLAGSNWKTPLQAV